MIVIVEYPGDCSFTINVADQNPIDAVQWVWDVLQDIGDPMRHLVLHLIAKYLRRDSIRSSMVGDFFGVQKGSQTLWFRCNSIGWERVERG